MGKLCVFVLVVCSSGLSSVHTAPTNTTTATTVTTTSGINDDDSYWTRWYDEDDPSSGGGDYETAELIAEALGRRSICDRAYRITRAQCDAYEDDEFDVDASGDILSMPCSAEGIICKNKDQETGRCRDYSIRFFCELNDGNRGGHAARFDMRIYIILAGIPVIIFIVRICWSCTFDKRRRLRNRPSRTGRQTTPDEPVNEDVALPPPSYEELFGADGPFSLSRQYSLCVKCKSSQCEIFKNRRRLAGRGSRRSRRIRRGTNETAQSSETSSDDSEGTHEQSARTVNEAESGEPVPTSSTSSQPVETQLNDTPAQLTLSSEQLIPPVETPVPSESEQDISGRLSATRSSRSGSVSSDVSRSTQSTDDSSPRIQTVQESQCDCPCHKSTPPVHAYDNPAFSPEVQFQSGRSPRVPGMHVPVFAMFRSPSVQSAEEVPPPTYREALKILKTSDKQ